MLKEETAETVVHSVQIEKWISKIGCRSHAEHHSILAVWSGAMRRTL
jgi:hypothetical protein